MIDAGYVEQCDLLVDSYKRELILYAALVKASKSYMSEYDFEDCRNVAEQIFCEIDEVNCHCGKVIDGVNSLQNSLYRELLTERILQGRSFIQIAKNHGYNSHTQARKKFLLAYAELQKLLI